MTQKTRTILLMEPLPRLQFDCRTLLQQQGYQVVQTDTISGIGRALQQGKGPYLLLLGYSGDPEGRDATARRILEEYNLPLVLLLSWEDFDTALTRTRDLEVHGYVFPETDERSFLGIVHTAFRLYETMEKTRSVNRIKASMLAAVSHDIRTPLNGMLAMNELLAATGMTTEQHKLVELSTSSGRMLLRLIGDILDLSRIESGQLELDSLEFDPAAVVQEVGQLIEVLARQKRLEFRQHIESHVPDRLRGDPDRLRRILFNLAGNAVKFTREGLISLRLGVEHESTAKVVLRFEVQDTGDGLPQDLQAVLLKPGLQEDMPRSRTSGSGLGLGISRHLVEKMNGRLEVVSLKGQGTLFWFTVELEKA